MRGGSERSEWKRGRRWSGRGERVRKRERGSEERGERERGCQRDGEGVRGVSGREGEDGVGEGRE